MAIAITSPALLLLTPLLLWIISYPLRLLQNYLLARRTGLPLVIVPIHPNNILWMIICVPLRPILHSILPSRLFLRINLVIYGWEFASRYTPHSVYGRNFILVTCGHNELNISEPALAAEVLKRTPKEFVQTPIGTKIMRVFGDNLITVEGERWGRQRKLIARNVNEGISGVVWEESVRQAREMVGVMYQEGKGGERDDVMEGLKMVAINVLGRAGYGVKRSWKGDGKDGGGGGGWEGKSEDGMKLSYIQATRLAVDHVVEMAVLSSWFLKLPFMPRLWKTLGDAKEEFPAHTKKMLERERQSPSEKVNLMSMLVKESDSQVSMDEEKGKKQIGSGAGLSEDEIMGNLYVFTAAGFDTTANTMGYAIVMLAIYPQWQDWICEEIDQVVKGKGEDLSYSETFPKLVRCLALMYETLRKFTPLTHVAKMTGSDLSITSPSSGQTHIIPKNTFVYINTVGTHHDPDTYGQNAEEFQPRRFVTETDGQESLQKQVPGAFLAWSAGPRNCPGMKMSQVEFVSVFMTIFRRYRVEIVRQEGETAAQAQQRILERTEDSQSRLTLQMNRPKEVVLRFVRR